MLTALTGEIWGKRDSGCREDGKATNREGKKEARNEKKGGGEEKEVVKECGKASDFLIRTVLFLHRPFALSSLLWLVSTEFTRAPRIISIPSPAIYGAGDAPEATAEKFLSTSR